ncbi:hypothetical protein EMIT0P201_60249 [Pseudomonas chlororaphis]
MHLLQLNYKPHTTLYHQIPDCLGFTSHPPLYLSQS